MEFTRPCWNLCEYICCVLCWSINLFWISCGLQVQAGKGINISARTFHLAQGDILKVNTRAHTDTHTHTHLTIGLSFSLSRFCVIEDFKTRFIIGPHESALHCCLDRFMMAKTTQPMFLERSQEHPCWAWRWFPLQTISGWNFTVIQKVRGKDSNWFIQVSLQGTWLTFTNFLHSYSLNVKKELITLLKL